MDSSRYRVIQWATGNTGQRALPEVIRHPALDLAVVLVYDRAKDGVDAGELCGEGPIGLPATTDRDAVLKLAADCCIYMPRATGRGQTRAGLSEDELVEDVVALLGSGTNIVTTCTDLFARGVRLSDANRARVLGVCEKGSASVWASGSDPGFITETLPLALLSVQRRVEEIEIEEFGDLSRRPSAHMVMEQMRFGKPLSQFDPGRRKNHLFGECQPPLSVLADIAGFDIDAVHRDADPVGLGHGLVPDHGAADLRVTRSGLFRDRGAALPRRQRQRGQLDDRLRIQLRRQDPPSGRLLAAGPLTAAAGSGSSAMPNRDAYGASACRRSAALRPRSASR